MLTLSIKVKGTYSNPEIGYLRPLLIKSGDQWEKSNRELIPTTGEVVTFSGYSEWVDTKFRSGEIFQAEIEEMDDTRKGDCEFTTARGTRFLYPDNSLALHTVISFRGIIDPNRDIFTSTAIKPTRFTFIIGDIAEQGKTVIGPFEVVNSHFNEANSCWECTYSVMTAINASRFKLDAYEVYNTGLSIVESSLFFIEEFSNADHDVYLSLELPNELNSIQAEKQNYIKDESLIKFLDDALPTSKKIGRGGRRDLIKQIDAVQNLNKTNKDRIRGLLESHEQKFSELFPASDNEQPSLQDAENKSRLVELQKVIDALRADVILEKTRASRLEQDLKEAESKIQKTGELYRLEAELKEYRDKSELLQTVQSFEAKQDRLSNTITQKEETLAALQDTVSEVEAQLSMSMRNFRAKAMEVLPLFGVLSSSGKVTNVEYSKRSQDEDSFFEPEDDDYVKEIVIRLKEQSYVASDEFLYCASALFLSSKFLGLYGPPGTGKTTLAELLASSTSGDDGRDRCLVSVGKGWSSHSDFLGYLNPFSDQFSFKNEFFGQFVEKFDGYSPLKTVIFDEASLSSPDVYLSDFFSKSEYILGNKEEELSISGSKFFFPTTISFLMTFNFDEGTERLSPKFVDRVPILHCDHQREIEDAVINRKQYKPFNDEFVRAFLADRITNSKTMVNLYKDPIFDEIDRWRDNLPRFEVSLRKKKHLLLFTSLVNEEMDISTEYMRDFVSMAFLLPQVHGFGDEYRQGLATVAAASAEKTKHALNQIIDSGSRFNQFSYL